jgi:hypothetical protein
VFHLIRLEGEMNLTKGSDPCSAQKTHNHGTNLGTNSTCPLKTWRCQLSVRPLDLTGLENRKLPSAEMKRIINICEWLNWPSQVVTIAAVPKPEPWKLLILSDLSM